MRKFDTKVQYLKYKVLREVAKIGWDGNMMEKILDIPKIIVPGKTPTMRCCVYKERAILAQRVKFAMGGKNKTPNVIQVLDIACDECPVGGYEVTNSCRGCLLHRCEDVCKFGAISFDQNHVAHIDKSLCRNCGKCAQVCPYMAIVNRTRPCIQSCKIKAISVGENGEAVIDDNKCISCGACSYACPFGAIIDRSYILTAIDIIKNKELTKQKVFAIVAPAIYSQFSYAKLGQVISGIKALGVDEVVEAALGADMVALSESKELAKKGFITSSCCPAFVSYIEKHFPQLKDKVSHNLSPMATLGKYIKEHEENAAVIFIGPCTAKKMEMSREEVKGKVDCVITFEELQALFDSKEIDIANLEESALDNASYYGRIFGRSSGLSEAVVQAVKEQNLNVEVKACVCDGIEQCKVALLKKSKNVLDANFIEGMACIGGCIGGAGVLTHAEKNKTDLDKFGKLSTVESIKDAVDKVNKK